jgi:hypothetical protein
VEREAREREARERALEAERRQEEMKQRYEWLQELCVSSYTGSLRPHTLLA